MDNYPLADGSFEAWRAHFHGVRSWNQRQHLILTNIIDRSCHRDLRVLVGHG